MYYVFYTCVIHIQIHKCMYVCMLNVLMYEITYVSVCLYLYVIHMCVCIRRKHTHLSGDDGGVRVMVLRAMSVESLLLAEALELTFVDATEVVVDVLLEPVGASSKPA